MFHVLQHMFHVLQHRMDRGEIFFFVPRYPLRRLLLKEKTWVFVLVAHPILLALAFAISLDKQRI